MPARKSGRSRSSKKTKKNNSIIGKLRRTHKHRFGTGRSHISVNYLTNKETTESELILPFDVSLGEYRTDSYNYAWHSKFINLDDVTIIAKHMGGLKKSLPSDSTSLLSYSILLGSLIAAVVGFLVLSPYFTIFNILLAKVYYSVTICIVGALIWWSCNHGANVRRRTQNLNTIYSHIKDINDQLLNGKKCTLGLRPNELYLVIMIENDQNEIESDDYDLSDEENPVYMEEHSNQNEPWRYQQQPNQFYQQQPNQFYPNIVPVGF